jgi:hypothetical protein
MIGFTMAASAQHPPERPFLTFHALAASTRTPTLLKANLLYFQPAPPSQSDPFETIRLQTVPPDVRRRRESGIRSTTVEPGVDR